MPLRRYSGITPRVRISTWGSCLGGEERSVVGVWVDADTNAMMVFGVVVVVATRQIREEWIKN